MRKSVGRSSSAKIVTISPRNAAASIATFATPRYGTPNALAATTITLPRAACPSSLSMPTVATARALFFVRDAMSKIR